MTCQQQQAAETQSTHAQHVWSEGGEGIGLENLEEGGRGQGERGRGQEGR